MAKKTKKILVIPGSELERIVTEAASGPVLFEMDGELFHLHRVEKEPEMVAPSNDAEAAIAGIRAAAGTWKDVDVESFKAYIRARRRASSRPPVHL